MLPKVKHFLASFKKDHKLILVHYLSSDSSSFWVEYKSVTFGRYSHVKLFISWAGLMCQDHLIQEVCLHTHKHAHEHAYEQSPIKHPVKNP